jgi:isocitrate dehydrogenase (NAD+)
MRLDHCKLPKRAQRLRTAISDTLNMDKVRTGDIGGKATTAEFTAALTKRIAHS